VLKIVKKDNISSEQECALGAELALMRKFRHANLMQIVDELDTPLEWYFVMELFAVRLCLFLFFSLFFYLSLCLSVCLSASNTPFTSSSWLDELAIC